MLWYPLVGGRRCREVIHDDQSGPVVKVHPTVFWESGILLVQIALIVPVDPDPPIDSVIHIFIFYT